MMLKEKSWDRQQCLGLPAGRWKEQLVAKIIKTCLFTFFFRISFLIQLSFSLGISDFAKLDIKSH